MTYTNFDQTGSTLTAQERADEAKRILMRIKGLNLDFEQQVEDGNLTDRAAGFLQEKLQELEDFGFVGASIKQLYFLRDLNEKLD